MQNSHRLCGGHLEWEAKVMLDPSSVRNLKLPTSIEPCAKEHENEAVKWLWNLYAELWDEEMRNDPLSATMLGIPVLSIFKEQQLTDSNSKETIAGIHT